MGAVGEDRLQNLLGIPGFAKVFDRGVGVILRVLLPIEIVQEAVIARVPALQARNNGKAARP